MKLLLSIVFGILMLAANGLLFLYLFERDRLQALWGKFFKGKALLVLVFYNAALLAPFLAVLVKSAFRPYVFMDHGLSGFIYIPSRLLFPVLVLTVIPYKILKSDYKTSTKVWGMLLCVMSFVVGFIALFGGSNMSFGN